MLFFPLASILSPVLLSSLAKFIFPLCPFCTLSLFLVQNWEDDQSQVNILNACSRLNTLFTHHSVSTACFSPDISAHVTPVGLEINVPLHFHSFSKCTSLKWHLWNLSVRVTEWGTREDKSAQIRLPATLRQHIFTANNWRDSLIVSDISNSRPAGSFMQRQTCTDIYNWMLDCKLTSVSEKTARRPLSTWLTSKLMI